MTLSFRPILLDVGHSDEEAMLVLRGDRLLAIVTRLSDVHGEAAGAWFIETMFRDDLTRHAGTLADLSEVEAYLIDATDGGRT